jgi:integration host factor subunit alpha
MSFITFFRKKYRGGGPPKNRAVFLADPLRIPSLKSSNSDPDENRDRQTVNFFTLAHSAGPPGRPLSQAPVHVYFLCRKFDFFYQKFIVREGFRRITDHYGGNMTLTKADLVQQVYKNHPGLTKAEASESVEAFLRISKDSLINGSDLLLSGFGKFNVKYKNSRRGRNPQTGDELTLDARRVVTFKPSGILREKINES